MCLVSCVTPGALTRENAVFKAVTILDIITDVLSELLVFFHNSILTNSCPSYIDSHSATLASSN